jgi:hypothetical protein
MEVNGSLTPAKHIGFLFSVQTGSGTHPASYPMGTGAVSTGVKWQEHEAGHSPPSSAEVKNGEVLSSLPITSSWHGA